MIEWIKIEAGEKKPKDCEEIVFWAKGLARIGTFDYQSFGFDEDNTGLRWLFPKVTHWAKVNRPDGI